MQDKIQYCLDMLPRVSRTFAPTIRMLPKGLNVPVTVAYLLCRIADTVEDTDALSVDEKKNLLTVYANIFVADNSKYYTVFNRLIKNLPNQTPDDELTHNFPIVYAVYDSFSKMIKTQIGRWVAEMSRGMHKYCLLYTSPSPQD